MSIYHFLKPETNRGDFRIYFETVAKSCRNINRNIILRNIKQKYYNLDIFYMDPPPGVPGMSKDVPGSTKHANSDLVH